MTHVLKLEEWESNGRWHCGDVSALAAGSNTWWYQCNILNLSPTDFVLLLVILLGSAIVYLLRRLAGLLG